MQQHDKNIDALEEYVRAARTSFQANENPEAQEVPPHILRPSDLFLDLTSSYSDRLSVQNSTRTLDEWKVYDLLQVALSNIFDLLYTKITVFFDDIAPAQRLHGLKIGSRITPQQMPGLFIRNLRFYLPWAAIGLFHKSHREAYNDNDVKVTYALLCCTAVLELLSIEGMIIPRKRSVLSTVSQYSLIGFFVRNKRHAKKMWVVSKFQCKDFLDQRLCMNPCDSSFVITKLVLEYVKKGWANQVENPVSYWKFNDHRGMWTLEENKCDQGLLWSLRRPFDESVLLWHIATDFCFHNMGASADQQGAIVGCNQDEASGQGHGCKRSPRHERAVQCREMSNYMIYLLFVKPEMLLPGTRRELFITANDELENILYGDRPSLKTILWAEFKKIFNCKTPSHKEILKGKKPSLREILTETLEGKRPSRKEIEKGLAQMIIAKVKSTSPPDPDNPTTQQGFIHDAWKISQKLLDLRDEDKMWKVIEGVWVEMLCFSAGRCRGYLHAKSLGTGPELITYIWLLLSHMGMETLTERLQRPEHSSGGDNAGTAP